MDMKHAIEIVLRPELSDDAESLEFRRQAVRRVIEEPGDQPVGTIARRDLIRALAHEDDEIRHGIAVFATRLGPAAKPAESALFALLTDRNPKIRLQAVSALRQAGVSDSARTLPVLLDLLKADDPGIRSDAIWHLGWHRPVTQELVHAVAGALQDTDVSVAIAAARTLGELGPEARAAAPALFQFSKRAGNNPPGRRLRRYCSIAIASVLGRKSVDFDLERLSDLDIIIKEIKGHGGPVPSIEEKIKDLTAGLPDDYDGRSAVLTEIHHAYRQNLAEMLTPALTVKMQEMPHGGYEDKKELAKFVNAELRKYGLTIKCPKTGRPASLGADPGNHPAEGRFHLLTEAEDGKKVRTLNTPQLSTLLESFVLMADDPDRKRWGKWTDRVEADAKGAKRG